MQYLSTPIENQLFCHFGDLWHRRFSSGLCPEGLGQRTFGSTVLCQHVLLRIDVVVTETFSSSALGVVAMETRSSSNGALYGCLEDTVFVQRKYGTSGHGNTVFLQRALLSGSHGNMVLVFGIKWRSPAFPHAVAMATCINKWMCMHKISRRVHLYRRSADQTNRKWLLLGWGGVAWGEERNPEIICLIIIYDRVRSHIYMYS